MHENVPRESKDANGTNSASFNRIYRFIKGFAEEIEPVNVCSCGVHFFAKNWSFELYRHF